MNEPQPAPRSPLLKPWSVLLGFLAGLAFLAFAGRQVTDEDWHKDFTRFHPMVAPDSHYQPTVHEMCAIVRARCRSDQILVIVGGNSVLLGVGQPASKMWTNRLQELLGPKYAVVNLAFRGSTPTDGGAIVAEVLRDEYPRQIYIANAAPLQGLVPAGIDTYRFILFDAYYKGLLLPWEPREKAIQDVFATAADRDSALETRIAVRLDSWLYFRNFWNWWSFNHAFTFPTSLMPGYPEAFRPRARFADEENDYETLPVSSRFAPEHLAAEMQITSMYTAQYYTRTDTGGWVPTADIEQVFKPTIRAGFPDPLKKRTLMLIGRNAPIYTQRLSDDILQRDDLAYAACVAGWEAEGYEALEFGRDFAIEDYGDRSHLTSKGGRKLAALVAPEVKQMAQELGYLTQ